MRKIFLLFTIVLSISVNIASASNIKILINREQLCQRLIGELVISPATYKIVKTHSGIIENVFQVFVTFDAQNVYGAVLRDTATCIFKSQAIVYYDPMQTEKLTKPPIKQVYFITSGHMFKDTWLEQHGLLMDMVIEQQEKEGMDKTK